MTSHYRAGLTLTPDYQGRTVSGMLVPFGRVSQVSAPGFKGSESFDPGAFDHQIPAANRVPLFLDHGPLGGKVIGRLDSLRAVKTGAQPGLYGTGIISRTTDGNDAIELIRDGVYPDFSIGFREVTGQQVLQPSGNILRKKADLFELAVVKQGAYADANLALRAEQMPCPTCGHSMLGARTDEDPPVDTETPNADVVSKLMSQFKLILPNL